MRAFILGISTKLPFLRRSYVESQRTAERAALADAMASQSPSQFVVVTGPKVRVGRGRHVLGMCAAS